MRLCQISLGILNRDSYVYTTEERNAHRKWWSTIAQLYGYMIDQNVKYGFISCFNRTWFFIDDVSDTLRVSNAVHCNSGHIMRAFAYFMHISKDDRGELDHGVTERRKSYDGNVIESDDEIVEYSSEEYSDSGSSVGRSVGNSASAAPPPSTRKRKRNSGMDDAVSLSECMDVSFSGEGRLGSVYGCIYKDKHIAIKFDRIKGDVIALQKERFTYERLASLQGVCIPHLNPCWFQSPSGMMIGFGMDYVEHLPENIGIWGSDNTNESV